MYATPTDLLLLFGPREIAGCALPDHLPSEVRVTGELLQLTVAGGDREAFSTAEQDAADQCLARILMALDQASRQMDTYLSRRYVLPLAASTIAANPLMKMCGDLARVALDDDSKDVALKMRRDSAVDWLRDVMTGQIALVVGATDQTVSSQVAMVPGVSFFRGMEDF